MTKFDIGIACGTNSDYYCEFLLENLVRTTEKPEDCRLILGINNFRQFDLTVLDRFRDRFVIEHHYLDNDLQAGSTSHGQTLGMLLSKMTSSKGMFLDVDAVFLQKGWDQVFQDEVHDDVVTYGLAYPNISKYKTFPSLVVASFDVQKIQALDIDFCPFLGNGPDSRYVVQTELEAAAWGTKVGSVILLDCGYQFPLKLHTAGYKGTVVPYKGTGVHVLGIGQEYDRNGKPFVSHLKGSSIQDRNHPRAVQWTNAVRQYMDKEGL